MAWFRRTDPTESLFQGIEKVDLGAVRKALDKGANVNSQEPSEGQTPLILAVRRRKSAPRQVAPGVSVRQISDPQEIGALVNLLIDHGADVNAADSDGITALHWAAGHCLRDIAKALIQAGANVNAFDKSAYRPLHQAADSGCSDVARQLIDAGAEVNARSSDGMTALAIAKGKVVIGASTDPFEPIKKLLRVHGGTT